MPAGGNTLGVFAATFFAGAIGSDFHSDDADFGSRGCGGNDSSGGSGIMEKFSRGDSFDSGGLNFGRNHDGPGNDNGLLRLAGCANEKNQRCNGGEPED